MVEVAPEQCLPWAATLIYRSYLAAVRVTPVYPIVSLVANRLYNAFAPLQRSTTKYSYNAVANFPVYN